MLQGANLRPQLLVGSPCAMWHCYVGAGGGESPLPGWGCRPRCRPSARAGPGVGSPHGLVMAG